MMNTVELLTEKNPDLMLFDVFDERFSRYGRVLKLGDTSALRRAMLKIAIPEIGNCYVADDTSLKALDIVSKIKLSVYGDVPIEAGYCNGHSFALNAEEYHRCSEVNFTTTGLVLLLALPEDIMAGKLDSKRIVGVYLPPDVAVEIYPRVLHFAPCRLSDDGFNCLVILTDGTNTALDSVNSSLPGEDGMLWMRNKWLICHPDSPQAAKGAYIGITGENITLKI